MNNLLCQSSSSPSPFLHPSIQKITQFIGSAEALDTIDTVELDNLIGELDLFQKEHEAKERERLHMNGHGEYQTPNNKAMTHSNHTNHNDSIISTSTAITHAFSDPDKNDKISLSASLNYSITSNASMMTNTTLSDAKFNCSDSEKYWTDNNNDLSADTGFENPSFVHLNDTNIVVMRDNDFPNEFYAKNAAEIVVLRCKDTSKLNSSNNNSMTDLNAIDSLTEQKQRLSSFRAENNNLSYSTSSNGSPASTHYYINTSINNNSIPGLIKKVQNSFASSMYGQVDEPLISNSVNVNNNVNVVSSNKPAITPRPASLLYGTVESFEHFFIFIVYLLFVYEFLVFIFYQFYDFDIFFPFFFPRDVL